jgi:hypothetical protein
VRKDENSLIKSPMQYLDQATGTLRDLDNALRHEFTPINASEKSRPRP